MVPFNSCQETDRSLCILEYVGMCWDVLKCVEMCWNVLEYVEISMGLLSTASLYDRYTYLYHVTCYTAFVILKRWPQLAQGSLASEAMPSSLDLTVMMMTGPKNMRIYVQNKAGTRTATHTHTHTGWICGWTAWNLFTVSGAGTCRSPDSNHPCALLVALLVAITLYVIVIIAITTDYWRRLLLLLLLLLLLVVVTIICYNLYFFITIVNHSCFYLFLRVLVVSTARRSKASLGRSFPYWWTMTLGVGSWKPLHYFSAHVYMFKEWAQKRPE